VTALEGYLLGLRSALPRHFAPGQVYHGVEGAMRLAREVGRGLAKFPEKQVRKIMGTLYSDLLVRFTFGKRGGVPLDNKEWIAEIRRGIKRW